ncbi:MAG TPA: hypothetical protein VEZ90_19340, partial [Blastocatellia bacterium]|nr:hypothetical protein [Blastocatellia bacterium]
MRLRSLTAPINPARAPLALLAVLTLVVSPLNANQRQGVHAPRSVTTAATTNTWMSLGPDGAEVTVIAIDPTSPSIVYAGTNTSGVFKSTDGGGSWSQAVTWAVFGSVRNLAIARSSPSTIYACAGKGVSQSLDGGANWARVDSGLPSTGLISCLAIDPTNSANVYVATLSAVFKTTTGGAAWQQVLPVGDVSSILIDPTNPATLYAGSDGSPGGVFKSTDSGQSWTTINSSSIISLALDTSSPATLFATTGPNTLRTTDGGSTWTSRPLSGLPFEVIPQLLIDPDNSSTIYGATFGGDVVKSTDSGASFVEVNSGLNLCAGVAGGIAMDPVNTGTLYAGSGGGGVYKTTNGGETWAPANSGLTGSRLLSFVMDPSRTGTIYAAGRYGGVYKSTDSGGSWAEPTSGIEVVDPFGDLVVSEIDALALDPASPSTLYAGGFQQGVFKSTDAGASWTQINSGLTNQSVSVLVADPKISGTVYAGTLFGGEVFKTTDGGVFWQQTNLQPPPNSTIYCMAIDPANSANIYVGSDSGRVFNSTDGGLTWNGSGITLQGRVSTLVIDPHQPSTIYAGLSPGGAFKSTDAGRSWTPVDSGFTFAYVEALAIDPSNSSILYAGSFDGVYISADAWNTWSQIRSGLSDAEVNALAIDPTTSLDVFASAVGIGAFKIHLAPDFQLGLVNQTVTVAAGTKTPVEVIVGRLADFAGKVTVTASAIQGIKLKPGSLSTKGSSVTFTLKVGSGTPAGTYNLQLTGVGRSGLQRTPDLHVQVQEAGP